MRLIRNHLFKVNIKDACRDFRDHRHADRLTVCIEQKTCQTERFHIGGCFCDTASFILQGRILRIGTRRKPLICDSEGKSSVFRNERLNICIRTGAPELRDMIALSVIAAAAHLGKIFAQIQIFGIVFRLCKCKAVRKCGAEQLTLRRGQKRQAQRLILCRGILTKQPDRRMQIAVSERKAVCTGAEACAVSAEKLIAAECDLCAVFFAQQIEIDKGCVILSGGGKRGCCGDSRSVG